MSDINLRATIRILGFKSEKRTKAEMFKDMQVGDIISMVITLQRTTGRRGNYATYLNCLNKRTDALTLKSQTDIMNILEKYFIYEQGDFYVV